MRFDFPSYCPPTVLKPALVISPTRALSRRSAGPDPGPDEVQFPGEPADGHVGGPAEPHPGPGALSSTEAPHGAWAGLQPELPHCH